MAGLLDGIMDQLGAGGVAQISQALGADESAVGSAVSAALPAILAGLAKNSADPQGAAALSSAVDEHSPSIFGQLSDLLASGGGDGAKILGHVLGGRQSQVEQGVAQSSGVDLSLITKLLPLLAPLVMGYLSKEKQSRQLDAGGLGQVLNDEHQSTRESQGGLGGMLSKILDADGDGSIIDDVMGKLTGH